MPFHPGSPWKPLLLMAAVLTAGGAFLAPLAARQAVASLQKEKPPAADDLTVEEEATLGLQTAPGKRALENERFPPLRLEVLNPGSDSPVPLDLASEIGKRPIVLAYFLTEFQISVDTVAELRTFLDAQAKGKVAFYPIVRPPKSRPLKEVAESLKRLKFDLPVILDREGLLQATLGAYVVPSIALIDQKGIFCFTSAISLKEPILGTTDLRESILMAVRGEEPPVVMGHLRYYPATDFIGEKFMDVTLPDYKAPTSLKLSEHVKPGRVTALLYWGAHCQYSKTVMPLVVAAARTYPDMLEMISIVRRKSGESTDEVDQYAASAKITFPILEDEDHRFTNLYRVVSTPTLILIRPDGVVDSVYTSSKTNFFSILKTRLHQILPRPQAPGKAPSKGDAGS